MPNLVTIEKKEHIAYVRLNRPKKYNALNPEMFKQIYEAGCDVSADRSVRSVILSGEGRGFCAGLDFESFKKMGDGSIEFDLFMRPGGNIANYAQLVSHIWKQVPVPVIAALHGVAYGGGLQIALGADIRLASPDSRLSMMEIVWGLTPDMSATVTLRDLVRIDVAKELILTGKVLNANDAAALGLVTRVCEDPLSEAIKMAEILCQKSPDAVVSGKRLIEKSWRSSAEQAYLMEETTQRALIGKPNQVEAINASFKKTQPEFLNRVL